MKAYELMLVLRSDFPVTEEKDVRDFVSKLTGGANITSLTVLGKKPLAYEIKKMGLQGKQTEGVYVLATLTGKTISVGAIEKEVAMGSDVLRYLLSVQPKATN